MPYVVSAFRGCEQITFNAETAEAAEKKCLRISLRALRALRSNVAFFHRLSRRATDDALPLRGARLQADNTRQVNNLTGETIAQLDGKPKRTRRQGGPVR